MTQYGRQSPIMKLLEGGDVPQSATALDALEEVGDLIAARLLAVPFDDPNRGELEALGIAAPPSSRASSRRFSSR